MNRRASLKEFFIASLVFITIFSAFMINIIGGFDSYGVNVSSGDQKYLTDANGTQESIYNLTRDMGKAMKIESADKGDVDTAEQGWWGELWGKLKAVKLLVKLPGFVKSTLQSIMIIANIPTWLEIPIIAGLIGVAVIIIAAFILGRGE
jgi:hypothetical protein